MSYHRESDVGQSTQKLIMTTIKRKNTTSLKHVMSSGIKAYQHDEEHETTFMSCIVAQGSNSYGEAVYPMNKRMTKRLLTGGGAQHKDMQHGLRALPHFELIILLEDKDKDGKSTETAVGVHTYPTANYAAADASIELEMPVASNSAVVQMHDTGEIDVMAFPFEFYNNIKAFIKALEKKTTLDAGDSIKVGNIDFIVQRIIGDVVTFRGTRQH